MCWFDYYMYIFSLVSYVLEIIRMDRGYYFIIVLVKLYNKLIFEKMLYKIYFVIFIYNNFVRFCLFVNNYGI